jgi:hypothetical protein
MFLAHTPHGHHDAAALEAQLRTAGFGTTRVETLLRESRSRSALGLNEGGVLRYAGKVGTGFNEREMTRLLKLMKPLERKRPLTAALRGGSWIV